jgi:hypothetical protein
MIKIVNFFLKNDQKCSFVFEIKKLNKKLKCPKIFIFPDALLLLFLLRMYINVCFYHLPPKI